MQKQKLEPRRYGIFNTIGFYSLCRKEVMRFISVYTQTLIAPVMTTLLFLAIFTLALGGAVKEINQVNFISFIAPGLIIMAMAQNAFANTSSSLVVAKVQGNIVDILYPPISSLEFVSAMTVGGIIRGTIVGIATAITMLFFIPITIHNIAWIIAFGILGSMMLALLGIIGGIWSEKFDHIAAVTNFVITPFTFLSGTFYSVERLPQPFYTITQFNPFFYMIDGFRYGFIGQSDSNVYVALAFLITFNSILAITAYKMVKSGYKLKN